MADLATQIGKDIFDAVKLLQPDFETMHEKVGEAAIKSVMKNFDERIPLSRQEIKCLRFIHDRYLADGISPSFQEMVNHLDVKAKSGIHRIVSALEHMGAITRIPHRSRSIKLTRLGELTARAVK